MTGLLLLAVFILAVVTVPVAWLLSYAHDLHGKVTRRWTFQPLTDPEPNNTQERTP